MPVFPTAEWAEEAVALLNADPEAEAAGKGWTGDFGLVVEAESGKLDAPFAFHAVPDEGRITHYEVLDDPDDLEDIDPAYLIRAPYSLWKSLLTGKLDPVDALLKRKLSVKGDVQPLIERMRYKAIADRILANLQTTFVDEA